MKIQRREFLEVCCMGAVAGVAAACGSDDNNDSSGSSSPQPAPPAAGAGPTATVQTGTAAGTIGLRWYGQSMFVLTSPGGTRIILDPVGPIGYQLPPPIEAAAATITHEHGDHANASLAAPGTAIIRGLTQD